MKLDLNCDLGEGEPVSRTRALMGWITSANVACGGHAGNVRTMENCVRLANEFGRRLGAHPGLAIGFGRTTIRVSPTQLELLLLHQVSALERIARANRSSLHHIKLHGALYHLTETDAALRRAFLQAVARWWPKLRIYACAGGAVIKEARRRGLVAWDEAFLDRAYLDNGRLVPRHRPGALLTHLKTVAHRMQCLLQSGEIRSISGRALCLRPRTVCVHSDTPRAVAIAATAHGAMPPL